MTPTLIDREKSVVMQTYNRLPVVIARAEGCRIEAADGTVYLDMLGGIAVNALGHGHPDVVRAVTDQVGRYMHVSNFFYQEPQVRLAEMLTAATGYDRVYFCNSGAEATETAIKLARRHGHAAGRYDIVGCTGGFHGRTYAALSVMDKPLYKDGMGPFLPNAMVVPYNDVDALRARVDDGTCAVILEYLQGEGGVMAAQEDFISALAELRDEYGFLVIADEVQTGVGRTGQFFAWERHGLRPDIVTMAKALGGGLPLGAVVTSEAIAAGLGKGMQGTTYGGNAVACAAGAVVVDHVLNHGLMEHVTMVGRYLNDRLQALATDRPDVVRTIRGRGCMQGVVLHGEAAPVVARMLAGGVIANATAGSVIRLVPPYVITRDDVDQAVRVLAEALPA